MNWTFVILATIIILLIYVLYNYTTSPTSLVNVAYLMSSNGNVKITNKPRSQNYTISGWFYLNDANNIVNKTAYCIFSRGHSLQLDLVMVDNKLCLILQRDHTAYKLIDSIPIQTWMYITVTVYNNTIVDIFINGKLLHSISASSTSTLNNIVTIGNGRCSSGLSTATFVTTEYPTATFPCSDANLSFNGVLSNLIYIPQYCSPKDVYDLYMSANTVSIQKLLTTYTVAVALLKNGIVQARQVIL